MGESGTAGSYTRSGRISGVEMPADMVSLNGMMPASVYSLITTMTSQGRPKGRCPYEMGAGAAAWTRLPAGMVPRP